MGDIIIEEVNYKAFVMMMGSLLLLIASVSLTVVGIKQSKSSYWVPGIMAALVFLILFTVSVINSMKVRKLLTITHEGIIDNSSISSIGFISFDEIKEFIIMRVYNKKTIAVIPKNIDSFQSQLSVVKRRLIRRNLNSDLPPVLIMVDSAKDMEAEDILSLLNKRLADYSSLYE